MVLITFPTSTDWDTPEVELVQKMIYAQGGPSLQEEARTFNCLMEWLWHSEHKEDTFHQPLQAVPLPAAGSGIGCVEGLKGGGFLCPRSPPASSQTSPQAETRWNARKYAKFRYTIFLILRFFFFMSCLHKFIS